MYNNADNKNHFCGYFKVGCFWRNLKRWLQEFYGEIIELNALNFFLSSSYWTFFSRPNSFQYSRSFFVLSFSFPKNQINEIHRLFFTNKFLQMTFQNICLTYFYVGHEHLFNVNFLNRLHSFMGCESTESFIFLWHMELLKPNIWDGMARRCLQIDLNDLKENDWKNGVTLK